jgi:translation initiation factor 4E
MATAEVENGVVAENKENVAPGTTETEPKSSEITTVFHDPNNFTVKHPLMHDWTLWFTKPPSGKVGKHPLPGTQQ